MNFSKYRFNFSSNDEGTFWTGVIELPVDENTKEVPNIFYQIDKIKDGGSKNFFLI